MNQIKYEAPFLTVFKLEDRDVILTSGGVNDEQPENELPRDGY